MLNAIETLAIRTAELKLFIAGRPQGTKSGTFVDGPLAGLKFWTSEMDWSAGQSFSRGVQTQFGMVQVVYVIAREPQTWKFLEYVGDGPILKKLANRQIKP